MSPTIRDEYLGWGTVASDPAIFNEILQDAGVSNVQVEEIYSLEDDVFDSLKPIYGLIFLFRVRQEPEPETGDVEFTCPSGLWFANQVVENSCASLALLNIVFNCPQLDLGERLTSFKNFTLELTPPLRGLAMYDFEFLRKIHNGYARNSEIMRSNVDAVEAVKSRRGQDESATSEDLAYHFIAYVPVGSAIYELDGLRQPIRIADLPTGSDWVSLVTPKIKERMLGYSSEDAMFTLLAVVKNRLSVRREQVVDNTTKLGRLIHILNAMDPSWRSKHDNLNFLEEIKPVETSGADFNLPESQEDIVELVKSLIDAQRILREDILQEERKLDGYHTHAVRTKHDYTPFIREYIKLLAEKNLVRDLLIQ